MTVKRFISLMIFALLFGACSKGLPRADFVVALESYPANLDPRYPADAYSSKVQRLIFNGLLKYDSNLLLTPDLAESYQYLSDTHLHFTLRRGIRFHDGKILTSADVIYTFQSILKPGSKSPLAGVFNKISQMKASGPYELDIELKEPFAPFLTALTVGIIPRDADDPSKESFADHPVGTGPYRFDALKKDQWIRLKANPDYVDGPPSIRDLEFHTVRDDTTRVLQMLRGDVDLVQNAVPLVMAEWLEKKDQLKLETDLGINYVYMAFNLTDPILKNRQVREAIGAAINRKELIQYQLKGFARPATGILAPSNWFYEPDVNTVAFDPERAKQLLDDAGFPDPDGGGPRKRFTLTYKTSNRRDRVSMARAIARQLEAVGIGVEIRPYEWGTFYRDIRTGNFQMFTSTWVGVTDPDIYHYAFHSGMMPPQGANRGHYQNEVVDGLLDLARTETNNEKRKEIYSKVQKILSLELPYISLWYEDNVAFLQKDVMGYQLRPDASFVGLVRARKDVKTGDLGSRRLESGSRKGDHGQRTTDPGP